MEKVQLAMEIIELAKMFDKETYDKTYSNDDDAVKDILDDFTNAVTVQNMIEELSKAVNDECCSQDIKAKGESIIKQLVKLNK